MTWHRFSPLYCMFYAKCRAGQKSYQPSLIGGVFCSKKQREEYQNDLNTVTSLPDHNEIQIATISAEI